MSLPSKSPSCLLKVPYVRSTALSRIKSANNNSNNNKGINWELPHLATQARCPIGPERVTCSVLKLQESLVLGEHDSLTRDQVMYFETAGNLKCFTSAFILSTLFLLYMSMVLMVVNLCNRQDLFHLLIIYFILMTFMFDFQSLLVVKGLICSLGQLCRV